MDGTQPAGVAAKAGPAQPNHLKRNATVTTDPAEIAPWIKQGQGAGPISVIFGTYQSGHRIAEALRETGATARVLIADEAHRTAGLRRSPKTEQRFRDFALCHDNDAFPATYRVYQTATPRIYNTHQVNRDQPGDWIVRTMDDETVFGVELYRKSYLEAVDNGWLADYRIIALGVNDPAAYAAANRLAADTKSKGRRALTTHDYLRGLTFALAMGGATRHPEHGDVPIKSCIAFMNTVDKSKNMADDLQSATVRQWLQEWMSLNRDGQTPAPYRLEHLDATSNVAARDNAKRQLAAAAAPDARPHGIINVGIFGEGTDSPSLNAVAFLEARKSPIDVIQAVGRAMRTAPGKALGYIICPIYIPPNKDPETHLSVSAPEEGWQELGQILLALRAHDQRIEDNLAELLQLYLPRPPETERTLVAIAAGPDRRISYREHLGPPGAAQMAVARALAGQSALAQEFRPVGATGVAEKPTGYETGPDAAAAAGPPDAAPVPFPPEPTQIITGKKNHDGSSELRIDTVARGKPGPDGAPGPVDLPKSRARARDMINKGTGARLPEREPRPRPTRAERADQAVQQALQLLDWQQHGNAITVNLLTKSGLTGNRVTRDLNILETGVREAARHLAADELRPELDRHFGLNNLSDKNRQQQADGCTIAALLLMNAAMLHQRIANGRWLPGVSDLDTIKNHPNVISAVTRQWTAIIGHDFKPILEPAVKAIYAIEDTGKRAGLERALRHLAAEAERIAETYADMGADHAGPLFNKVMGNQASDGAYFTRPVAAAIAARLTLDACGDADWTAPAVWQEHKTVDLACGSGTLLAAMLAEMKRRAKAQGAPEAQIADLQKLAVEETLHGLDINPVSLQLAASQLTAGNHHISYRRMGLHLMPYGPLSDRPADHPADHPAGGPAGGPVSAGSLELLGQQAIVPRSNALALDDDRIASQSVWQAPGAAPLDDAVDAAKDARIVIMNPPFTNRSKMGEKFPKPIQAALRSRVDAMEQLLTRSDPELADFVDKNTVRSLFVALADKCLRNDDGILTMVTPTIALCTPSGENERRILAQRWHIHTVLTCHQSGNTNLSQNTSINESVIIARRHSGADPKPDTRFINLDRFPIDDSEVDDWDRCLADCAVAGVIANGWGEVSYWPADRIEAGDWTPAIWRAPELAAAAARFANDAAFETLSAADLLPAQTGRLLSGPFEQTSVGTPGGFPVLKSKGADGQTCIQGQPDEYWIPKNRDESIRLSNGGTYPEANKILGRVDILVLSLRHGKLGTDILPMGQNPRLPPQPLRPLRRL